MIDLINYISYIIILKQFVQNNNTLLVRKEVIVEWFNELTQYLTWNAASLCIVISSIIVGMCCMKMNSAIQ